MKQQQANLNRTSSLYWLMGVHCKLQSTQGRNGFTLIELLVALIVGSIITLLILGFTVQLMQTNQREGSRSDTQRELQAAIDYINRDVREAVYVYDGDCLRNTGVKTPPGLVASPVNTCTGILNYLPAALNSTTNLPVLAFWRLDPLPDQLLDICRNQAAAIVAGTAGAAVANVPCSSSKMYTLVVYSLNKANPNSWRGRTRISRYTLPQFTSGGGTDVTPGWFSPLERGFPTWPRNPRPPEGVDPLPPIGLANNWVGSNQVLADFIDDRTSDNSAAANAAACPSVSSVNATTGVITIPQDTAGGFYATPAQTGAGYINTDMSRRTFYACVRGGDAANLNQEVIVRIQGNATGQPGLNINNTSVPLTMETRILTRGVLGKN
jgi:prepilin-type N-terminal cleavage/methylation domain-containing protein